jgi:ribosomal protein L5
VDPFAPNQSFEVPGVVRLVINEQTTTSGDGVQDIKVNALHLTMVTGEEVIVSSAQSDVRGCPGCPPKPACADFMTGGGFINVGTGRANFGLNAGIKPNSTIPEIHLNYIDHNTGMHVRATSISVYVQGDAPTSRHLEGSAEINGAQGFT